MRFSLKEPPQGADAPWVAEIDLHGGATAGALYDLVVFRLVPLYTEEKASGDKWAKNADLFIRPDKKTKDRKLTAGIAEYVELPVREGGKGKGKGNGRGGKGKGDERQVGHKTKSPTPERASSTTRARTGRR